MGRKGALRSVTGTDPGAGAEFSQTIAAGKYWQVLAVSVTCAQGNTQTPWPILTIDDGTTTLFQGRSGTAAQNADVTTRHSWAPNLTASGSAATTVNTGPLPAGMILGPGFRITSSTTGIGANTNYGAPQFLVIEYDGPPEFA